MVNKLTHNPSSETFFIKRLRSNFSKTIVTFFCVMTLGCADAVVPQGRSVDIPPAASPSPRDQAVNEGGASVTRIRLDSDALVPKMQAAQKYPDDVVGPYELRGETVAGALQLILANYDMPLAFETEEGLTRRITVSNLSGKLGDVVKRVCGLADLYCSFDEGAVIVKEFETFVVNLPPLGDDFSYDDIASGLEAITGITPIIDNASGTMIYQVTQRNAKKAEGYFGRLKANTALVVYETYIWEVQLDAINSAGIQWEKIIDLGSLSTGVSLAGSISNQLTGSPISIGLPTKGTVSLTGDDVFRFLSEQGAVKTISQPQLTVLSGSSASMSVLETRNYIETLTRTVDENNNETFATTTGTVDNGFTLTIGSRWDDSTVYGDIQIDLNEFLGFEDFTVNGDETLQLPRTSERTLDTQVRVRPGDSVLIAGLVRESDQYDTAGPGFMTPIIPTGRTVSTVNTELVFLLRPRVIVYDSSDTPAQDNKSVSEINAVPPAYNNHKNSRPVASDRQQIAPFKVKTTNLPMGSLSSDLLNPSILRTNTNGVTSNKDGGL
jgi:hypothetical protein